MHGITARFRRMHGIIDLHARSRMAGKQHATPAGTAGSGPEELQSCIIKQAAGRLGRVCCPLLHFSLVLWLLLVSCCWT